MDMEMIEIEAFVAVSETGGFSRAAERLHRSQPAVSRRIELLESELGAPLFERIPGGVRPTDAGEVFLPYARRILAVARDGATAVSALEDGTVGEITLALVGTLASTKLTGRLQAFRDSYPAIRLKLLTALSDQVGVLVARGEATFGLRYFQAPSGTLTSVFVENESLAVVCSSSSPLASGETASVHQLAGHSWVGFPEKVNSSGEPFTNVLRRQLLRADIEDSEIIPIDSLTAQKRLIEARFGIGLLPESSIQEELRLGSLAVLNMPELETTVPIYAVFRSEGYLSPAARRLLSTLTDSLSPPQDIKRP
jgi:DNA-binding transcriptional LysR family regulator